MPSTEIDLALGPGMQTLSHDSLSYLVILVLLFKVMRYSWYPVMTLSFSNKCQKQVLLHRVPQMTMLNNAKTEFLISFRLALERKKTEFKIEPSEFVVIRAIISMTGVMIFNFWGPKPELVFPLVFAVGIQK